MNATLLNDQFDISGLVSIGAKDQYQRQIAWLELEEFPAEEEIACYEHLQQGRIERSGSSPSQRILARADQARDYLIAFFQPFVFSIASKLYSKLAPRYSRSLEVMDLVQEGNIGLLTALGRCEYTDRLSFRAVILKYIRGYMLLFLREHGDFVHLTPLVRRGARECFLACSDLSVQLGRQPTSAELAAYLGVSLERLREFQDALGLLRVESLQALMPVGKDGDEMGDYVQMMSLHQQPVEQEHKRGPELAMVVQRVVRRALPPRQRAVVELRYGLDEEVGGSLSREEVGSLMGLSAHAVSSLETTAKGRLRDILSPVVEQPHLSPKEVLPDYCTDYYTMKEAAQVLGVSIHRMHYLLRCGHLQAVARPGWKEKYLLLKQEVDAFAVASCESIIA